MGTKFLIVDDAAFMREILKNILTTAGGQVVGEAENGQEAIEFIQQHKPDVVVLDLVMPVMNGMETAKIIKESYPEIKILGCSTLDQVAIVEGAKSVGFDSFIHKPFTKDEILEEISKYIHRDGEIHGRS